MTLNTRSLGIIESESGGLNRSIGIIESGGLTGLSGIIREIIRVMSIRVIIIKNTNNSTNISLTAEINSKNPKNL